MDAMEREVVFKIARAVRALAECTRRQIAAIVVGPDGKVHGVGVNRSRVSGISCLNGDCPRGRRSHSELPSYGTYDSGPGFCIAVHAEEMALERAGEFARGGILFTTAYPCEKCAPLVEASGIAEVVVVPEEE